MSQKIINVGTVANDGTGDTIRGAFTNVNANFTEVYNNVATLTAGLASIDSGQNTAIQSAYNTTNAAFAAANSANLLAYNIGDSANLYSISVGAAGNLYSDFVGTSANSYSVSLGTAGNLYASLLSANNAVGANAWSNAVGTASNNWSLSTFSTLSNTAIVYNTANASFAKANAAFANTTGTFQGNLFVTGSCSTASFFNDSLGSVREKLTVVLNSDATINTAQVIIIANNLNTINIKVPDDTQFLLPANVGTKVEIYQYNTGSTKIVANDAAVTVLSSNNWANIAGQYLSASIVKVKSNTWILTGSLKA